MHVTSFDVIGGSSYTCSKWNNGQVVNKPNANCEHVSVALSFWCPRQTEVQVVGKF
jgi:hypothetical protein